MSRGLQIPSDISEWGFKGRNFLFTIGIDQYENWKELNNAVKDVDDIVDILTSRYQFEPEHVVTLRNEEATEDGIREKLVEVKREINKEDNLVVFFSGHGHYDEDIEEGYWVPVDARLNKPSDYISNSDLLKWIRSIKTHHTLVLIDSCFSGTLVSQSRSEVLSEKYPSSRVFASGRKELVDDGTPGENSPFASAVLSRLRRNNERVMRASDLISHVTKQVESDAGQTPIEGRIKDAADEGGEFVFHLKVTEEEIWTGVTESNTAEEYRRYIDYFPTGVYVHEARQLIRNLTEAGDWERALKLSTPSSLMEYMESHPTGPHYDEARSLLEGLEEGNLWTEVRNRDAVSGYLDYLRKYPEGKHSGSARVRIQELKVAMEGGAQEQVDNLVDEVEQKAAKELDDKRSFRSAVEKGEGHFARGEFSESIRAYEYALGMHHASFVPSREFLQDRIKKANQSIELVSLVKNGENAARLGDYRAALGYFEQARDIEETARVRDWISHVKSKLQTSSGNTRSSASATDTTVKSKPNKKSSMSWVWIVLGIVVVAAIVIVAALLPPEDDYIYESETTQYIPAEEEYNAPPEKLATSPLALSDIIVGNWVLTDRIVQGQSARANGVLLEAHYVFEANGTLRYSVGSYPNTMFYDGQWSLGYDNEFSLNVYGLGTFPGVVTDFSNRSFSWVSTEPDGFGGYAQIVNSFMRE